MKMKKLFSGLAALAIVGFLTVSFSVPASAADQMPMDSHFSNVSPNNQKLVTVAEFGDLANQKVGVNPQTMTIEALTTDRVTISSSSDPSIKKLCTVIGFENPVRPSTDGICVSFDKKADVVVVATFKNGSGAPTSIETSIAASDFRHGSAALPKGGQGDMACRVVNGKSTGDCRKPADQS